MSIKCFVVLKLTKNSSRSYHDLGRQVTRLASGFDTISDNMYTAVSENDRCDFDYYATHYTTIIYE